MEQGFVVFFKGSGVRAPEVFFSPELNFLRFAILSLRLPGEPRPLLDLFPRGLMNRVHSSPRAPVPRIGNLTLPGSTYFGCDAMVKVVSASVCHIKLTHSCAP